jgi:hypothetical protein
LQPKGEILSIGERRLLVGVRLRVPRQAPERLPRTAGRFLHLDHWGSNKPPAIEEAVSMRIHNAVNLNRFHGVNGIPVSFSSGVTICDDKGFRLAIHDGAINIPRARAGLSGPKENIASPTLLWGICSQPNRVILAICSAVSKWLERNHSFRCFYSK